MIPRAPDAPPANEVIRGNEVDADVTLETDVCIVGSGAGGAVMSAELSQAGKRVVVLEEGGYFTRADFNMQEGKMYPLLYQDRGGRATSDQSIVILQGRAVGGSTVVNWTTCFRTPETTLDHWKKRWGVEGLDHATLGPSWDKVEARLGIEEIPLENINRNNRVLWDGATKLGWNPRLLRRNVRNCRHSGFCGMGCPFDAKQAMHITYLRDALDAGARIHANARVERLEREGNRIVAAHATVLDPETERPTGRTITVKARRFVAAGGAINTPRLLLRSGIHEGPVGKRTWFHTVVASVGLMPQKVEGFYGAPQSVSCHQFAHREGMGFFIETAPVHPVLAALNAVGFGPTHRGHMEKFPYLNALIGLCIDGFHDDEQGATVTLRPSGAPKVDYHFTPRFWSAAKEAMKAMARIQLAAGAEEVRTLHADPLSIRSEADVEKIDRAEVGPNRVGVFTAHIMGGCQMGADPAASVVRSDFRHHVVENLYVVDGSVFPTSLGVNPSLTIYGLSTHAAKGILAAS